MHGKTYRDVVGVGVLEAEVVFLDDVHGVEDPLVQLLPQRLFLQGIQIHC